MKYVLIAVLLFAVGCGEDPVSTRQESIESMIIGKWLNTDAFPGDEHLIFDTAGTCTLKYFSEINGVDSVVWMASKYSVRVTNNSGGLIFWDIFNNYQDTARMDSIPFRVSSDSLFIPNRRLARIE